MNQTVTMDIAAVMVAVRASGLLVSLCTISVPSGEFNDAGAPDPAVPYVPLTGHEDIPCTAPPLMTGDSTGPSEIKALSEILGKDSRHVLLDNYYPEVQSLHNDGQPLRASIDGFDFDVMNVESDSQKQMTRMAVQLVSI